ncbi:MAG: HNH endonuclease [Deltaproteobacteria bacterium]|nr:MAG: HNH endonuclease [Deltaproteobacteria bacterium]TMQ13472.1 MAG: HNH endonuclease [Deltaproteobacteria bacterium]
MLCEGSKEAAVGMEQVLAWASDVPRETPRDWRTVDRALRAIRRSRSALDAEEMHWLREAETLQIWRPLGMVSALDYLERALDYAPRTAQDRLRVARALGSLPQLTAALAGDDLAFSAVRELTRVATPATEAAWIAAAVGKNLRQIEELVAGHRTGDRPDDPPDPQARTHVVRFELAAETFALLRQARMVLDNEHGTNLPDDAFVATLCHAVLDRAPATEPTGRAKFQIALTVCQRCRQGWQEGAGAQIPIEPAAVDRAMCDAQHIGSIDGPAPERAYQDIPPSVARFVWRRDGGRCRVDGCRSARGLELHHIIHRADGGGHDALNLILCCSRCHQSHHAGLLTISGTAEQLVIRRPGQAAAGAADPSLPISIAVVKADVSDASIANTATHANAADAVASISHARAHVGAIDPTIPIESTSEGRPAVSPIPRDVRSRVDASKTRRGSANVETEGSVASIADAPAHVGVTRRLDAAILCTQAKAALAGLGWKPALARAAVEAAVAQSRAMTLEQLIFESLRRCPVPKA